MSHRPILRSATLPPPRAPAPLPLPLFDSTPPIEPAAHAQATPTARPARARSERTDRHLAAARRLSQAIRHTAARSPEQVRTGQLICRHLLAMLDTPARPDDL